MREYAPTFSKANEEARKKLWKELDKHLEGIKASFDAYLNADDDKSERRKIELTQYMGKDCGDRRYKYHAAIKAMYKAFPKPVKPAPEFSGSPAAPVVKSAQEAGEKGFKTYVTIQEGPAYDVPDEWKDPNIEWVGGSVTEIGPTLSDQMEPARMTYEGQTYYRGKN